MNNKLPKAFKNKWVKALKSGKYNQGKSCLKEKNEYGEFQFCCLGVAADLIGLKPVLGYSTVFIGGMKFKGENLNTSPLRGYTKLPEILWGNEGIPKKLADMNDCGDTFEEIADYIQENL